MGNPEAPPARGDERRERIDLRERMAAERQAFALPLRALATRAVVTCEEHRSVADAVRIMQANDVGSVIIVDAQARPRGIFTGRDLVPVAAEGGLERRVSELMSRDLVSLPPHAFAYEAALEMTERRIRHILVTEGERLVGVVSERDLFALQRLGMGELTMEIRLADSVDTLSALAVQIRRLAALLVDQGTAPEPLTLFISVLNDRLTRRVIEVVRRRHELNRIRWTWLAFGSEGRLEQTFSTDQDNGLVFAVHEDLDAERARALLIPFARDVNQALDGCGFPLCAGNIMAGNPALCLTLEEWRAKMRGWLSVSVPQALAKPLDGLPTRLGEWHALPAFQDAPSRTDAWADADERLFREYRGSHGELAAIDIYYFSAQQQNREVVNFRAAGLHRVSQPRHVTLPDGSRLTVNLLERPDHG